MVSQPAVLVSGMPESDLNTVMEANQVTKNASMEKNAELRAAAVAVAPM